MAPTILGCSTHTGIPGTALVSNKGNTARGAGRTGLRHNRHAPGAFTMSPCPESSFRVGRTESTSLQEAGLAKATQKVGACVSAQSRRGPASTLLVPGRVAPPQEAGPVLWHLSTGDDAVSFKEKSHTAQPLLLTRFCAEEKAWKAKDLPQAIGRVDSGLDVCPPQWHPEHMIAFI